MTNELEQELDQARKDIQTDGYPMSIGEITNLYKEGDLVISPAFQRLFRWDDQQKSRLIESILLGIPIPSIFVSQDDDGRWELVDGLQRVSTLLQLQDLLDDEPPLQLRGTELLPSLNGLRWRTEDAPSLTPAQRRDIKRAKFDIKIIKRSSKGEAKYDLFQRLNSFGSSLTPQEIRNATLVSINSDFVSWVSELAKYEPFVNTTRLSDSNISTKYDEELVLRFFWLHQEEDVPGALTNFQEKLEKNARHMAEHYNEIREPYEKAFKATFDLLDQSESPDIFRRWYPDSGRFKGGFLNTAYEVIALGLGYLIQADQPYRTDTLEAAKELWMQGDMTTRFATGKSTDQRLAMMIPKGRELLASK
ncbi:DUF262 domain-containing protein [Actinomyces haliotis]|uniref:DUF262 domain-containing protein n=1 Tax=Actinomyces haliotis TaxID=1280843 RepID=UPI00188FE304|nr:DUF262 domain-containing protein [Actinomyces haliotis]